MASNLRGAPLFLRPSVVRQLLADIAAIHQAIVEVPVVPVKLVDRPRASQDPRLAKANDDLPVTAPDLGGRPVPQDQNLSPSSREPRSIEPLRNAARRCNQQAVDPVKPEPDRERIRVLAQKLAARRAAESRIDYARLAEAHRRAGVRNSERARTARPLVPAPSREECRRCGIPGWKGCDHFLPCLDQLPEAPEERLTSARPMAKFTGRRQGIGSSRL